MKIILLFFITAMVFGQESKLIEDPKTNKPMLIGITSRDAYQNPNFKIWFNEEYENYKVDSVIAKELMPKIVEKKITIVLGTWCSDSRREVPRFLKVLDNIGFCDDNLKLINVDRTKNGIANETEDLEIELVPTFIIYENDEEIGRIVETPEETLELDLLDIIE